MTGRHAVLPAERRRNWTTVDAAGPSSRPHSVDRPTKEQHPTLRTPSKVEMKETRPAGPSKSTTKTWISLDDPNIPSPSEMPDWMQHFKPTLLNTTTGANDNYVDLTKDSPESGTDSDLKTFMDLRQQQSQQVQTQLERHILARQDKQKRDFKKRHHDSAPTSELRIGSLVLMKNPSAQRSKLHKGLACEGPYRLVDLSPGVNPNMATLEDANNRRWNVNIKRLAAYSPSP